MDPKELTHFIPYDSPYLTVKRPRHARAYCGKLVNPNLHNNEPTCPTCRKMLEDEERDLPSWAKEWIE